MFTPKTYDKVKTTVNIKYCYNNILIKYRTIPRKAMQNKNYG